MVTVAEELPFVAVVDDNYLKTACSNCFAANVAKELPTNIFEGGVPTLLCAKPKEPLVQHVDLKTCARCKIIHYCSKKCQREDWNHHKNECNFLVKAKFCPDEFTRFASRAIVSIKKGDLPVAFNGRTFDDLMDHADDIAGDSLQQRNANALYANLLKFMDAQTVPSQEEVISIYGKLRTNAMAINSLDGLGTVGRGLYIGLSVHDHSCRPDCAFISAGPKVILRAKDRSAKYSKDLTFAYLDVTLPRKFRQERLQSTHFFSCQCERCMDEEEDLWERSGKPSCYDHDDGVVLPRDNGKPLVCSKCGRESFFTLEEINNANKKAEIFCTEAKKDQLKQNGTSFMEADGIAKFFHKSCLSPYNLYQTKISEAMEARNELSFLFDEKERMIFLQAKERMLERYAPFTREIVLVKRHIFIFQRQLFINIPVENYYRIAISAGERASAASKEICGPEYPLTKEIQDLLDNTIQMKFIRNPFC